MKIGIIGCGGNSDYHIAFAKMYPGAEIVGIVDMDQARAKKAAVKHKIKNTFQDLKSLIASEKPDIVHIVTPPATHYSLTREALSAGCNCLVEKPMALNLREAAELYDIAEKGALCLCTMHNHLFDPCMAKAVCLAADGRFGKIINVESYYGFNTFIPSFRDYPQPNVLPWTYELPGGPYHDVMAHPIYALLEYTGRPKDLKVTWQSHHILPQGMPDEIRILVDGERALGTLTLSFAAKPYLHFIRIYGTRLSCHVDINTMSIVTHPLSVLPKAIQRAMFGVSEGAQLMSQTVLNVTKFLLGRLKPYQGMKELIHRYYDSVVNKSPMPVTKDQALNVIETMDRIWEKLSPRPLDFKPIAPKPQYLIRQRERVLVTGGTGFLGSRIVDLLTKEGYPVRVLARKLSNTAALEKLGVEIVFGDVAEKASLEKAFDGIDVIIHAAAGTSGTKRDGEISTLQGTRNILSLCRERQIRKLIYISSMSVYGPASYKENSLVKETFPLEPFPEKRGHYSSFKQAAEGLVVQAMSEKLFPIVVLRPGAIYGPGCDLFTPMMGFSIKGTMFFVIGGGSTELPLVYVDNTADAVVNSIRSDAADNRIFNVVDDELIDKRRYVAEIIRPLFRNALIIYFPYPVIYFIIYIQEVLLRLLGRPPILTRYRLVSSQKKMRYDNAEIVTCTGWRPKVTFSKAVEAILKEERRNKINSAHGDA